MEAFWTVLAWLRGRLHWKDPLVGGLVEQLESKVRMCTVSQGG